MLDKFGQAGDLGIGLMILYVRPTGDVEAAKERLSLFRDEVIRGL